LKAFPGNIKRNTMGRADLKRKRKGSKIKKWTYLTEFSLNGDLKNRTGERAVGFGPGTKSEKRGRPNLSYQESN